MQSSSSCRDTSTSSLGERRGKSDLARFSLDSSWARGVSDSSRSWVYPSPPMSGSPPLPPQRNPEFDTRSQGSLGAPSRDVRRSWQTSQAEPRENFRVAPVGPPYQQDPPPAQYAPYQRVGDIPIDPSQYQFQQQQQRPPQQQMAPLPMYPIRHPHQNHFHDPERFPIAEESGYAPKAQRKTKGHVASACVPCKRAHLRCDAQRPCSRCVSNGKEEACIDVQHKKRGRPRLRDEREHRFEGLGQTFSPQPDHLRRQIPLFSPSGSPLHQHEGLSRSGQYRVLKSQTSGQMIPRFLDHASPADANIYGGQIPPPPNSGTQDLPYAYLNMEFQISTASRSFCELLGLPSVAGRKLTDMVATADHHKIYRFRHLLENERQEREPHYLPPIFEKAEEDRVIQSIGMSRDEFRTDHQDVISFQEPTGQLRSFQVRLGLAKKESTYFVVFVLVVPATSATPQDTYQVSSSPYHPRDAGAVYRPTQQSYGPPPIITAYPQYPAQYGEPRVHDTHVGFRQPPPLLPSNTASGPGPTSGIPSFSQPFPRPDYSQTQNPRQIPRGETPQGQASRQNELTLPPIQGQRVVAPAAGRVDDRGGRVDIGGLLENPESQRR